MRRLLVAGFAALAVVLGLVVTTGVASAAAPSAPSVLDCVNALGNLNCDRTTNNDFRHGTTTCTPPQVFDPRVHHCVTPGTGTPTCALPQVLDPIANICVDPRAGGHYPPGGWGGGVGGGHWIPGGNIPWGGPTLFGHQLWVEANLGLDICGYGNSYDTFLNRNLRYRSQIDRLLDRNRWQSLYSSDCNSGLAVLPNGLTLVNGNLLNLDLLGLNGAGTVNVCDYPDYNVFDNRFGSRFGSRWGTVRNRFGGNAFNEFRQLRVNARCTTVVIPSSTTIVQAPNTTYNAAPADPSGNDAASNPPATAPAPLASGPVPSGAVQTGGDSAAFVLAHNRAV